MRLSFFAARLMLAVGLLCALPWAVASASDRPAMRLPLAQTAPMVAIARAGDRFVAVGDHGVVLLSENGVDWRQAVSVPVDSLLTAVMFSDDLHGWAVGHGGVLLYTSDGGENWTLRTRLPGEPVLLSIWFNSAGEGVVVGAYGYAARTADSGNTWSSVLPAGADSDYHLNQVFPGPNSSLFIVAESGGAYRSFDGGKSWQVLETGVVSSLWTGLALRDGRLLLAGMSGRVVLSEDQGETWRELETGFHAAITGLAELKDGRLALSANGGVLSVADRRLTHFTTVVSPDRQNLAALVSSDAGNVVSAGFLGMRNQRLPQ